jgi:hypothetical protein
MMPLGPQTPARAGRLSAEAGARRVGKGAGDRRGAAQQGLAGVADDFANGVEEQEAPPFGSGGMKFLG